MIIYTVISLGDINFIKKIDDFGKEFFIPEDERNSDYKQYLAWLSEGNIPKELDINDFGNNTDI